MGQTLRLPGGVDAVIQVRGSETAGAFMMLLDRAPTGWLLPPHRHDVSETIHVTSGRLWMEIDGERRDLGAGETVHLPAGLRHSGGTAGPDPVERVVVFSPAGMEDFFEELATVDDPAGALELATRHGWRFD